MRLLEPFRRNIRSLLPRTAYRAIANLTNRIATINSLGLENYKRLYARPSADFSEVTIGGTGLFFRPGTPDADAIIQNLARNEWLQAPIENVKYILDGGAYIGDSTFAFLLKYPAAKVVCVEPNRSTQFLLERNLKSLAKDTVLVRGGIASETKEVQFGGDYVSASIQTARHDSAEFVTCYDIGSLMRQYDIPFFDIVKLDIEGAEFEVLTQNNHWLDRTRQLLVEFHGQEIERSCKELLLKQGFDHHQCRSVHYFNKRQFN